MGAAEAVTIWRFCFSNRKKPILLASFSFLFLRSTDHAGPEGNLLLSVAGESPSLPVTVPLLLLGHHDI